MEDSPESLAIRNEIDKIDAAIYEQQQLKVDAENLIAELIEDRTEEQQEHARVTARLNSAKDEFEENALKLRDLIQGGAARAGAKSNEKRPAGVVQQKITPEDAVKELLGRIESLKAHVRGETEPGWHYITCYFL